MMLGCSCSLTYAKVQTNHFSSAVALFCMHVLGLRGLWSESAASISVVNHYAEAYKRIFLYPNEVKALQCWRELTEDQPLMELV